VLAGLLAYFALSGGTDASLYATGVYPPMFHPMADHLWALALTYRVVFAVVGGFVAARLAPAGPLRHVMVLGGIETVLGVLTVLANWNKGPEFGPHWFAMCVTITALPCTALGGVLGAKRIARVNQ